jgi:hypothetical protein
MAPNLIKQLSAVLVVTFSSLSLLAAQAQAAERFTAKLAPLNSDKIGTSASGTANLEIEDGKLTISIEAAGLAPGLMHLQHFHGFPDGKAATCPTSQADTNGDGYVDLIETEPMSGTTMVPFHAHPTTLEIPDDTYPASDKTGAAHYRQTVSVAELEKALEKKFKAPVLALTKRVIFLHGVANDAKLPDTVKSLPGAPAQVTLPVACGVIEAAQ